MKHMKGSIKMVNNNVDEFEKRQLSQKRKEMLFSINALDVLLYAAHMFGGVIYINIPFASKPDDLMSLNSAGAVLDYIDSVREGLDDLRRDLGMPAPSFPPRPPIT